MPGSMSYPLFRVVGDSYYIYTKYLYDPVSVLAASKIDLLPYQLEDFLNLLDLAGKGIGVRVLIAYETGLGKTILAGLFIKEMLLKGRAQRILVLVPPNARYQWKEELKEKFDIEFEIDKELMDRGEDPLEYERLIASMDTLKGDRWLNRIRDEGFVWDIVIVDEIHRASPENLRAQLISEVSKKTTHFLGLTATPHDGKEENFIFRLSLIDPSVDETNWEGFLRSRGFRRKKKEVVNLDGEKIFPQKVRTETRVLNPTREEKEFYRKVENYVRNYYRIAEEENNRAIGLIATIVGRSVASSIKAGVGVLERRLRRLITAVAEDVQGEDTEALLEELREAEEEGDDARVEEIREKIVTRVAGIRRELVEKEEKLLKELISQGNELLEKGVDTKAQQLLEILEYHISRGEKIIVFTEFLDTLYMLRDLLSEKYGEGAVEIIEGSMSPENKKRAVKALQSERVKVLVATDAAGESLNLQSANVVINYEVPWNPVVFIQRVGRVYRYGQRKDIHIYGMLPYFKVERRVLEVVLEKIDKISRDFDIGSVEVIGSIISEKDVIEEIKKAYAYNWEPEEAESDVTHLISMREGILYRIKKALELAEAAKRHVRAEKLFEEKGINDVVTEEDVAKYLFYLKEAGFASGSNNYYEIKPMRIDVGKIALKNKPSSQEINKLRDERLIYGNFKIDNPAVKHALLLGMAQKGEAILIADKTNMASLRIIRFYDGLGELMHEMPVVITENEVLPYESIRNLDPYITLEEIKKEVIRHLFSGKSVKSDIRTDKFISQVKNDIKERIRNKSIKIMEALNHEIDYFKKNIGINEKYRESRIRSLESRKREEFKRMRNITSELGEEVARIYLISISDLSKVLEAIAEEAESAGIEIERKVKEDIEEFNPELWKLKKEVELAGMDYVMVREIENGRVPKDVSADGRGYDIESKGENEIRRIEVKSFKNKMHELTLTENEYKAAKFYGDTYYLYIVENAIDKPELRIIRNPAERCEFEVVYRPYYVLKGLKMGF